jgi:hypothetical protein
MTPTAQVLDFTPAQLQRRITRSDTNGQTRQQGIFADLADGTIIAQFFLNFAGFEWDETKFFLLIIGLCGDEKRSVELFDEELAQHARCTDRTIRNWRAAYIGRTETINFAPLVIIEGEYNSDQQRYLPTTYCVGDVAGKIEEAVVAARALPEYAKDRLAALERAATEHYEDLPDAPPKRRRRKPKKSLRSPVIQSINNADKNLKKGKQALSEMSERMRAALLAGQGQDLREMLLSMRGEIDELLSVVSEEVDTKQLTYIPENFSGIPPAAEQADSEATEVGAGEQVRFREEDQIITRKRSEEPDVSPEAVAAWNGIEGRLNRPKVQSVKIPLRPGGLPPESDDPPDGTPLYLEYRFKIDEAISLKEARGMSKSQAVGEVWEEFGEFEDWLSRRPVTT